MGFSLDWSAPIEWVEPSEKEVVFLIVRHGETEMNTRNILAGSRINAPLNETGHGQAREVAEIVSALQKKGKLNISSLHSSHLTRAVETAGYFSKELQLDLEQHPDLREIDWGIAEGHPAELRQVNWGIQEQNILNQYPDRKRRWDFLPAIPEAEKYNAVLKRTLDNLKLIAEANLGKTVLVVSHGRVIKTLTAEALDLEEKALPYPENCGVSIFRYTVDGRLEFIEIRDREFQID